MRIAIGGGYRTAVEMLFDVNAGLAVAYEHFTGKLNGFGGMAGTDGPGAQFATAYDEAANAALSAYSDIVAAAGNLASIANASAANHDRANRASIIIPGGYMYDPEAPLRDNRAAKVWRHNVPQSLGSDGSGPDWWHFVADAVGYLYPDASTVDLKAAGGEWTWQATVLEEYASSCEYAVGSLREQSSLEIDDAVAACTLLRDELETLASSFRQVGQLCEEYAERVEDTRDAIHDIAKELAAWTVGTQVVSHGLALFTAGASEAVGQTFQASRIAVAAAKIRTVLSELMMWVSAKLGPLNMVAREAAAVSSMVVRLRRAGATTAAVAPLGPIGRAVGRADLNQMQLQKLRKFEKQLPKGAEGVLIAERADGAVSLSARVPGRVPGSAAIYSKVVDSSGTTTSCTRITIVPSGSIEHVKDKMVK